MLLLVQGAASFAVASSRVTQTGTRAAVSMAENDPIGSPVIKAINALQEALQNSPAATFKKGLAKMQAGDYDQAAVRSKLDSLMAKPAVMFSFTT